VPSGSRRDRLNLLVSTMEGTDRADATDLDDLIARAAAGLDRGGEAEMWLSLAVLRAALPIRDEVIELRRMIRARGSAAAVAQLLRSRGRWHRVSSRRHRSVRVLRDAILVDVHHTARTGLSTGIQRVVRETIARWVRDPRVVLVGWDDLFRTIQPLGADERQHALAGGARIPRRSRRAEVVIPWRSLYFLPELATEPLRMQRVQALAEFSGNRTAVIGFDCVPLTSAETTAVGMGSLFAKNLRAVAEMDRVAAISSAAATEYRGWRDMLAGIGLTGPEVTEVMLPDAVESPDGGQLASAREALDLTDDLPLLLCVGAHEPRKNHLAVLYAAEQLWRAGREFRLLFIGGNAWRSAPFFDELAVLRARGRPVRAVSAVPDDVLWGAYRLATATVFPSLNEGYGLPVGESLAAGTPVVTSGYGSMAEIARSGGAVLVDPRDDLDLARGIESALFDGSVQTALRAAAAARPRRTWDDYATELWAVVVGADD